MSTKGLERRGDNYREHVEGWTCEYRRNTGWSHGDFTGPSTVWTWVAWRGTSLLGEGVARTRNAARAAARAVVMAHEAKGLVPHPGRDWYHDAGDWYYWRPDRRDWLWRIGGNSFPPAEGTAPTLREARKAAKEASNV